MVRDEAKFWEQNLAMMDTERFSEEQINAVKQKITILRALARTQVVVAKALEKYRKEKNRQERKRRKRGR